MSAIDSIFYIAILIFSVVVHEVAHGFMALRYGDQTAKHAGRLTLNPLPHIDLFGSIILPFLLFLSHAGFMIGWAKPVPYNPDNLSNRRWGEVMVAAAGIFANLFIALVFGLLLRYGAVYFGERFITVVSTIVLINLALAIFNLVPIPPLDGSKILFGFLPRSAYGFVVFMQQYSLVLLIAFILFFSDILIPILSFLFSLITGFAL